VARLLSELQCRWAFCGAWALDLFLNRQTRAHKDVDVAILRRDQLALQKYLTDRGWDLRIASNGTLSPWPQGQAIERPLHCIWCRPEKDDRDFMEILLNESNGGRLRFRRNEAISIEFDAAFLRSVRGHPILSPQLVLLYKSKEPSEADDADLRNVLAALDEKARVWLVKSVVAMYGSNHPWIKLLTDASPERVL